MHCYLIIKIKLNFLIIFLFLPMMLMGSELWSVRMAESVMQRHPNRYGEWDYVTGTVLRGFEELWRATGDQQYYDYIQSTVDYVINENGTIDDYSVSKYNIDEINEGRMVLLLYKETGLEKYSMAADLLRSQLAGHPRTSEGGFWHKEIYPHQMWLDGLYMGSPFYAEYSLLFNDSDGFDDVVLQLTLMEKHGRDPSTGLLYHGWDESKTQAWADPITGQSPSFWGRAIGWYAMALVDVMDFLPLDHSDRDSIIAIIDRLAQGMFAVQDESGVWWQVVDQDDREGNYLESSVSCMMVYSMAKAIRMGYINESYLPNVLQAYDGILNEFVTVNQDCTINLIQTCITAGLGGSPYRDGSYEYYVYQTGVRENDGKGVGPFITASLEIERMSLPQNFIAQTLSESAIQLTWRNVPNSFEGYQILRSSGNGFNEIARISISDSLYNDTGLDPLTLYAYRIRSFIGESYGLLSNTVRASTLGEGGKPAYPLNPSPADGAVDQEWDVKLSWEAGTAAESHDVYFGENDSPAFIINQVETTFDPGILNEETTYYWRIDGINSSGTTTGPIWSFSTKQGPIPADLVAHWPIDEGSGTMLQDIKSGNNATLTNTDQNVWQTGAEGTYISFDGVDDYAIVAHDENLNFDDKSFSISFWINHTTQDRAMRYIIKGTHSSPGTGKRYEVFHHQSNNVRFSIDDNSIKSVVEVPNTNFVTGDWVHVVAIRDAENKILKLYADTVLQGSEVDNTGNISQNEDLLFGVSPDEDNTNFEGSLDDIRIFNYAISDSVIQSLYSGGISSIGDENRKFFPDEITIKNYPNPFNNVTRISYSIPRKEHIKIAVYNIAGQKVAQLLDEIKSSGHYTLLFVAGHLPSGLFLVRIDAGSQHVTRKIVLIK